MPQVNPDILRWARETTGLSLEEASKKLNISQAKGLSPVERLTALETGVVEPSRPMLVKMAKRYRRPLLVFYMEKPPREGDRGQDFRNLPDSPTDSTNALVDALIRDVHVRQSIMRAALEDEEEVTTLKFVNSAVLSDGTKSVADTILNITAFDLHKYRSQPTPADAFQYLRGVVEQIGVFVLLIGDLGSHHTAFDLDVFRGFVLSDDIAPFIVINDRDSRAAWSFTLLHELTHILLGQTGISGTDNELEIERFCNQVASKLLLPEADIDSIHLAGAQYVEDKISIISQFAFENNLSSSMVAYNLFQHGKLDRDSWMQIHREYRGYWLKSREERRERQRGKKGGPSYYVIRRHRLGENLISLVHQMVLGGTLTTVKASKVLGIAPNKLQNLIEPRIHVNST